MNDAIVNTLTDAGDDITTNRTNNVVMAMLTYTHYMNICILFHAESFDDLNNKLISRRLVFLTMIIVVAVIAVVIEQLSSQ